jgi:hypothetical protein
VAVEDLVAHAVEVEAKQQYRTAKENSSPSKLSKGKALDMAALTALRSLFRMLAAELPAMAHLPLKHEVMLLLTERLQSKCVHAARVWRMVMCD